LCCLSSDLVTVKGEVKGFIPVSLSLRMPVSWGNNPLKQSLAWLLRKAEYAKAVQ